MALNYTVLEQTAEEIWDTNKSPSVSMWPYLIDTAQTQLFDRISIYMQHGGTPERTRLLYMNETALTIA